LHPFGTVELAAPRPVPAPVGGPYWRGWDIARGVVGYFGGFGGAVVDAYGGMHPFAAPGIG
jgi:hypothetical protein